MSETSVNGWHICKIEDIATEVRYGTSAKTSNVSDGIPVLRMGNIVNGNLDLQNLKYLPANHAEFPTLLLESGDLLFNRTNSPELVGKTAIYKGSPLRCSFASYLIRLRFIGVLPQWVSYFLNCPLGKSQINKVVSQNVGQANVNGTKLKNFTIPLPPFNEQKRIVAKIEELFSELEAGEESFRQARRQLGVYRQSLLKQAFEGKLTATWRKQNPHLLESPDQLLGRIQEERKERFEARMAEWERDISDWEAEGGDGKKPTKPKASPTIVRRVARRLRRFH